MTVEAARITMMAKRSAHDELRREGEARTRRTQEVTKEVSGWKHRLETAEQAHRRAGRAQGGLGGGAEGGHRGAR